MDSLGQYPGSQDSLGPKNVSSTPGKHFTGGHESAKKNIIDTHMQRD